MEKVNEAAFSSKYNHEGIESVLRSVFGADDQKNAMLTLKDLSVGNPCGIFFLQERVSMGFEPTSLRSQSEHHAPALE